MDTSWVDLPGRFVTVELVATSSHSSINFTSAVFVIQGGVGDPVPQLATSREPSHPGPSPAEHREPPPPPITSSGHETPLLKGPKQDMMLWVLDPALLTYGKHVELLFAGIGNLNSAA